MLGPTRRDLVAAGAGAVVAAIALFAVQRVESGPEGVTKRRSAVVPSAQALTRPDASPDDEGWRTANANLAQTFGPEDAHRIAFADEMGSCSGTWGGEAPKH